METMNDAKAGSVEMIETWLDALTEAVENGDKRAEKRARLWIARHAAWATVDIQVSWIGGPV